MGRENVVHIYDGMLLIHKKEKTKKTNFSQFYKMCELTDCCTEWSKSEREKQIYNNACC